MEWLFFLLPIAAISGWLAAQSHYKKLNNQQNSPFSPEYFKGLMRAEVNYINQEIEDQLNTEIKKSQPK